MSDSQNPDSFYLVEQQTNRLFKASIPDNHASTDIEQYTISSTQYVLPTGFYHIKIDSDVLYYCSTDHSGEYLNKLSLNGNKPSARYLLNGFNSYDVKVGVIIVADIKNIEGDVHRTMH